MPLSYPQVASPTDRKSSPVSPKTPWKATGIVALATFDENKSWPRREGKVGNAEFSKQNEAFSEEKAAQLCSIVRPPHFWLSAAFEVVSKSQADLCRLFSYVQISYTPSVGRAPTQRSSKISYIVDSIHSFCLQKAHVLGTRELELVMLVHKQWALVTWKGHLRLSASEVGDKSSPTCQKMPKGPFFQFVRSRASCRDLSAKSWRQEENSAGMDFTWVKEDSGLSVESLMRASYLIEFVWVIQVWFLFPQAGSRILKEKIGSVRKTQK